jgi:hypothetical protein
MPELERELRALAAQVELPAERDLWPAVHARLGGRRPVRWFRVAVVAVAALAAAIAVAFAVPPARAAILRFLGLEGVSIVRVERLPPVTPSNAVVGTRTTVAKAAALLGFQPLLPDIGRPDGVYLDFSNMAVLLVYGKPLRLRLEETQLGVFQKMASAAQPIDRVNVGGNPGVWIPDAHLFDDFFGQPRLSGSALLWEQDGITLRLEGRLTKGEALRIARSARSTG